MSILSHFIPFHYSISQIILTSILIPIPFNRRKRGLGPLHVKVFKPAQL